MKTPGAEGSRWERGSEAKEESRAEHLCTRVLSSSVLGDTGATCKKQNDAQSTTRGDLRKHFWVLHNIADRQVF